MEQAFQLVLAPGLSQAARSSRHPGSCRNTDSQLPPDRGWDSSHRSWLLFLLPGDQGTHGGAQPPALAEASALNLARQRVRVKGSRGAHWPGLCSESDGRCSENNGHPLPFSPPTLNRSAVHSATGGKGSPWFNCGCSGFVLVNAQFLIF